MHVGHWRGYVLSDVYTRIKWLEGYNILHPMGWDALDCLLKMMQLKRIHPKISTEKILQHLKRAVTGCWALYDCKSVK